MPINGEGRPGRGAPQITSENEHPMNSSADGTGEGLTDRFTVSVEDLRDLAEELRGALRSLRNGLTARAVARVETALGNVLLLLDTVEECRDGSRAEAADR